MDFPSSLRPSLFMAGPLGMTDGPDLSFMCSWRDALTLPGSQPQNCKVRMEIGPFPWYPTHHSLSVAPVMGKEDQTDAAPAVHRPPCYPEMVAPQRLWLLFPPPLSPDSAGIYWPVFLCQGPYRPRSHLRDCQLRWESLYQQADAVECGLGSTGTVEWRGKGGVGFPLASWEGHRYLPSLWD